METLHATVVPQSLLLMPTTWCLGIEKYTQGVDIMRTKCVTEASATTKLGLLYPWLER